MTSKPNNPRAFTLTEVMLSVALVLILLLGVNSVFRMTSDTVGAGQAISTINRDHRAVQATLYRDVKNAVTTEAPCFIIVSQRIPALRRRHHPTLSRTDDDDGPESRRR